MCRKVFTALALVFLLTSCSAKSRLVIYTWSDMFPPEILSEYEKETRIKIKYVNFDENETMMAKLQAARGGKYDLIIADDYMVENVINEGLAQQIDRTQLSRFQNINPLYQGQFYDPSDEYSIPYGAGVQTIVYDPQKIDIVIRGYHDLWDPALEQRIGIIGNFRVINGMALKTLWQSYNTNSLQMITEAGEQLKKLAPNIRLIRDDKLEDELIAGEIYAAVMYTDQATTAKIERPDLKVVYPFEGVGFGIMAAFIPVNAPNSDAAHSFLNFILDPERGARCFEYIRYYSTFSASDSFINEEYRSFLTMSDDFQKNEMEMIQNINPDAEALHEKIFIEFKSATGRR